MYLKYFKSIFDLFFSLLILLATSPILFVIFLLIKLDGGPALFFHTRIGKCGKKIKVFKFRTMEINAEEKLNQILSNNEELKNRWLTNFRLDDDPRVTTIGRFLRKSKLDELPQLLNVVFGQMSLVGPRPITQEEFDIHFADTEQVIKYQSVKPGITGYWQVNTFEGETYQERIKNELFYVKNITMHLDAIIIWLTVKLLYSKFRP